MENYSEEEHINIGSGKEISIREFANLIKNIAGWNGIIKFQPIVLFHNHNFDTHVFGVKTTNCYITSQIVVPLKLKLTGYNL